MSTTVASHVHDTYFASGIHEWLSEFGTIYYNPDAATDANTIEKTYTVAEGDHHPDAIIDFDSGELVELTGIDGATWNAANTHLREFWQASATQAFDPTCYELPDGDQFSDGILAVSPYSVFGALFNSDSLESECFPKERGYADARPLTMLYKEQAAQWSKEAVRAILEGNDGGAVGPDFMGVLVAQTTGKSDVPVGLITEINTKTANWTADTTLFAK